LDSATAHQPSSAGSDAAGCHGSSAYLCNQLRAPCREGAYLPERFCVEISRTARLP
jgi:hypothetical protein